MSDKSYYPRFYREDKISQNFNNADKQTGVTLVIVLILIQLYYQFSSLYFPSLKWDWYGNTRMLKTHGATVPFSFFLFLELKGVRETEAQGARRREVQGARCKVKAHTSHRRGTRLVPKKLELQLHNIFYTQTTYK